METYGSEKILLWRLRTPERPSVQTLEEGERPESARLGEGYKFASATFFRRELNSLSNPRSVWWEIAWLSSLRKKKGFLFMKLFKAVF